MQSSPQNIPTPNCPVTCLHLHVTFLAQLRHTPVTPFSAFQVLLPPTRVSWTLFAPFPNYGSFFKNEVCITLPGSLSSPSSSEWAALLFIRLQCALTLILHVCLSKGIHDLQNFIAVISDRKGIKFWPSTWSSVMINSKHGAAPEQVVMLKAGFWDLVLRFREDCLLPCSPPPKFTKCPARFQQEKEAWAHA